MEDTTKSEITDETNEIIEFTSEVEARAHLFQRKNKRKEIVVPVPEWNMKVLLCAFSGTCRSEYYAFNADVTEHHKGTGEFAKRLWFEQVRLGCFHSGTHKPIFQAADRDMFMDDEDGAVIERLAAMVREISDLNSDVTAEAKKKLQAIQNSTAIISSQNGLTANV